MTRKGPWRGFWYDFAESRGGGPIEAILKAASSEMTYAEAAVKAAALAGINYQSEEAGSRRGDIWAREKELISEIAQHTGVRGAVSRDGIEKPDIKLID